MKNVIFICNGNIHRSVIAEAIFKKILKERRLDESQIIVDSYGIQGTMGTRLPKRRRLAEYAEEWNASRPTLQRLEIDIDNHFFQMISEEVMKNADLIIAMDDKVYKKANNSLIKHFAQQREKMYCFCEFTANNKIIMDPSGNNSEEVHRQIIENIYQTLNNEFDNILDKLF